MRIGYKRKAAGIAASGALFLLAGVVAAQQDSALDRAQRLDAAGRCQEAETIYAEILQARAAHVTAAALNNLGNHYLACSQPDKAAETFERLLRMNPAHANANLQMARLAEQQHDAAKALRYLDRVPNPDPEIQIEKAGALAAAGKREAASRIIAAAAKSANDPRIVYSLAMTCARSGFYPEAEQAFERVLAADPSDAEVLFNLGAAAARAGHFERARDAFSAVLKQKPEDANAIFELGRAEASLRNYKRAIYLLAQAKRMEPRRAEIDLALARATESAGYYGDSIAAWNDYMALRPDDDSARRDRALVMAYTRAGHDEGAKDLVTWVDKHPNDAIGHFDLALVRGEDNRAAAMEEASRAIALDARLEAAYFYRAWLLERSGSYEESLRDAKAAAALRPDDARALDLVGLDELDLSRPAQAEPVLRAAIRLSPEDADITFHLARCLLETGRHEEARPLMARFKELRSRTSESPREQAGIVEAATLPPDEMARRVAAQYAEGVKANPNDATLKMRFGAALLATGQVDAATSAFGELLRMGPDPEIAREAGNALMAYGQYRPAIDFLRPAAEKIGAARLDLAIAEFHAEGADAALKIVASIPDDAAEAADAHLVRATILGAAGRDEEALAELNAMRGAPASRPALVAEGATLLARHGEGKQALEMTEQAIRSSSDSSPAYRELLLTRVAAMAAGGHIEDARRAAMDLERRWPEWDEPYVAEALLLEREQRSTEAKTKLAMADALGWRRPDSACGPSPCACESSIWAVLRGCEGKAK